jgi:hypothetical protein
VQSPGVQEKKVATSGDPQEHVVLFAKDQVTNQINQRWQLIQVQSICRRKEQRLVRQFKSYQEATISG